MVGVYAMLVVRQSMLLYCVATNHGEQQSFMDYWVSDDNHHNEVPLVVRNTLQKRFVQPLEDHIESLVVLANEYRLHEHLLDSVKDLVVTFKEALFAFDPLVLNELIRHDNGEVNQHGSMAWEQIQKQADKVAQTLIDMRDRVKDWGEQKTEQCKKLKTLYYQIALWISNSSLLWKTNNSSLLRKTNISSLLRERRMMIRCCCVSRLPTKKYNEHWRHSTMPSGGWANMVLAMMKTSWRKPLVPALTVGPLYDDENMATAMFRF